MGYKRASIPEAARQGWGEATFITKQIFGLLGRAATLKLTSEDKRGVGGPVKIAQAIGQSAQRGWMDAVLMSAGLSVNLGLLNLMPFPALDGGRILFLGYELVMRRPLDPRKEGLVHAVGMVMLLAFMLFITLRDVVPFFQGLR
jgi:regulator of sigma E protease